MAFREQLLVTMAPSGAGKTYVRGARYVADEYLPEEEGDLWTNLPLHVEALQEFHKGRIDPDEIARRIKFISQDALDLWATGESGPWEYFDGVSVKGAHIQIDEAHLYIKKQAEKWSHWLSTVRHDGGATVEIITQVPENIPNSILNLAGVHIDLIDSQSIPDPFFKILMADWYELGAKITGRYVSYFVEQQAKKKKKKYVHQRSKYHARDPRYFALYNSYNQVGTAKGSKGGRKQEYEKRGWFDLLRWFYMRNFWTLTLRGFGSLAVVAFLVLMPFMSRKAMEGFKKHQDERMAAVTGKTPGAKSGGNQVPRGKDKFGNPNYWPKPELDAEAVKKMQAEMIEMDRVIRSQATEFVRLRAIHQKMIDNILKAKQANDLIGMLFKDKAVTVGGRVVIVGDKLSLLDGEKVIKAFDYENSKIEFTDDSSHWVTIGQRRVQEQAAVPETFSNGEADKRTDRIDRGTGAGTGTGTTSNQLQSGRSGAVQRDTYFRTPGGGDNNSIPRPVIYSDYVGPKR